MAKTADVFEGWLNQSAERWNVNRVITMLSDMPYKPW